MNFFVWIPPYHRLMLIMRPKKYRSHDQVLIPTTSQVLIPTTSHEYLIFFNFHEEKASKNSDDHWGYCSGKILLTQDSSLRNYQLELNIIDEPLSIFTSGAKQEKFGFVGNHLVETSNILMSIGIRVLYQRANECLKQHEKDKAGHF